MRIQSKTWPVILFTVCIAACSDSDLNLDTPDDSSISQTVSSLYACSKLLADGLRPVPDDRADRFLGKVQPETAKCRGGDRAVAFAERELPWVDVAD